MPIRIDPYGPFHHIRVDDFFNVHGVVAIPQSAGFAVTGRRIPAAMATGFPFSALWSGNYSLRDPEQIRRGAMAGSVLNPESAMRHMLANISPTGTRPGTVIASPSRSDPDYFFHWVRDAALTMDVVSELFERSHDPGEKARYLEILKDYAVHAFETMPTDTPSASIRRSELKEREDRARTQGQMRDKYLDPNQYRYLNNGEVKYVAWSGAPFTGPWGRPQDDGPALRVAILVKLTRILLDNGETDFVRKYLYNNDLNVPSVIKSDLEYTYYGWEFASVELWEEVRGLNFYTRMAQRGALLNGADLADSLNDGGAARVYRPEAELITNELEKHWDAENGYIRATIAPEFGPPEKTSHLDVSVILAVLHNQRPDGFFGVTDERVLATAQRLIDEFSEIYPINRDRPELPGTVIGRYPEDTYDPREPDRGKAKGNPWVLATAAMAELYFRAAEEFATRGEITVTKLNANFFNFVLNESGSVWRVFPGEKFRSGETVFAEIIRTLITAGNDDLERIHYHANRENGSLAEQIDKYWGGMASAQHLTWSYAAYLRAVWAREKFAGNKTPFAPASKIS